MIMDAEDWKQVKAEVMITRGFIEAALALALSVSIQDETGKLQLVASRDQKAILDAMILNKLSIVSLTGLVADGSRAVPVNVARLTFEHGKGADCITGFEDANGLASEILVLGVMERLLRG